MFTTILMMTMLMVARLVQGHGCDDDPCGERGFCENIKESDYCCHCQPGTGGENCLEKQPTAASCIYCSVKQIPTPDGSVTNTICQCQDNVTHVTCGAVEEEECLASWTLVEVESGAVIPLAEASVGVKLLSLDTVTGKLVYSPLLAVLHQKQATVYITITTTSDHRLTLTPSHLIYVVDKTSNGLKTQLASTVKIGDWMSVISDGEANLSQVASVEKVVAPADEAMAPLTSAGTLVADGVLVSCYAHTSQPVAAHLAMAPVRLIASVGLTERDVGSWYNNIKCGIHKVGLLTNWE